MNSPTTEQQAVLDSKARVRIVQAVPGSGKTWLVANLIKDELARLQSNQAGIAALSFTRVGGKEIRRAVSYDLCHPHFVGTLDSFFFKFVVRPFLRQVFPQCAVPRLIPAEWEPNKWQRGANNTSFIVPVGYGKDARTFKLFDVCFLGEDQGKPVVACKQWDWDPIVELGDQDRDAILNAKRELWKRHGWLTHSDAAYLASKILGDKTHGIVVRAELVRRFGLIVVDELQDTGWYLGQCVMQLLAEPTARGVLVGDPDQAIFEFNGARPDLFDRFLQLDGSEQITLGRTLRCNATVCKVAQYLAGPSRRIEPTPDRIGRAFLLSYETEKDIHALRNWLARPAGLCSTKIVARQSKTVRMIAGVTAKDSPALGSVPFNHLHRSVNNFRQGRLVAALASARAALGYAFFDHEDVTDAELAERQVDPAAWKRLCVEAILEANIEVAGESFEMWGKRMADFFRERLGNIVPANMDGSGAKKIRLPTGKVKSAIRQEYLVTTVSGLLEGRSVAVQTIHAVKGETHDLTVFVCPDQSQERHCPSAVWWSDAATNREERRIAFVAVTRTRGDLIVCVSQKSFARLQTCRTEFFQSFEQMSINDFIAMKSGCDDIALSQ